MYTLYGCLQHCQFFGGKLFIVFWMNLSTFSWMLFPNFVRSRIFIDAVACHKFCFVAASVTVICIFAKLETHTADDIPVRSPPQ
jgi:hypothetical protein